jgi:hypothetical protein
MTDSLTVCQDGRNPLARAETKATMAAYATTRQSGSICMRMGTGIGKEMTAAAFAAPMVNRKPGERIGA